MAASLAGKLPNITGGYAGNFVHKYYQDKGAKQNSFKFSPVGEEDILKSLLSLNVSKATGLDGLSARFLKDGANQISSAIAHNLNLSLYSGRIPDDMKTARVVPLYKKNSKSEPGNYRLVSILTVMSKILEKTVHKQLENYLGSKKLLYDYQSGFRNPYSTDSCLTQLTDQIRFDMDKGNYTCVVMSIMTYC